LTVILDSSAVLAALQHEPGMEAVQAAWDEAVIGAVNHAEVVTKLIDRGLKRDQVDTVLRLAPALPVTPFDSAQADLAGKLRDSTRTWVLSLGDRACLALALTSGAEAVLTTDHAWSKLDVGIAVRVIR
jgi:PIN domain nuclease of toxin-antitoxin system